MPKVLITGGAGFIGYHLGKALASQGYVVTLCDNFFRGEMDEDLAELCRHPKVHLVACDLTQPDSLNLLQDEYDFTYHLAAINGTRHFYEMPDVVLRVNILTLINLLDRSADGRLGKILFASSSEVYAGTARAYGVGLPTPEEVPLVLDDLQNPRLSYGASKILGESLVINYARVRKLPMAIVRYHNVYGPRMGYEHVIPQFCRRILNREDPFSIFGADDTRAFCYVDDAVRATQLVMECDDTNSCTLNVGNPQEEIAIVDLASLMFDLFNFHPGVNIESAPEGSVKRRCPDTSNLTRLTGYYPETALEAGLVKTHVWYKKATVLQGA